MFVIFVCTQIKLFGGFNKRLEMVKVYYRSAFGAVVFDDGQRVFVKGFKSFTDRLFVVIHSTGRQALKRKKKTTPLVVQREIPNQQLQSFETREIIRILLTGLIAQQRHEMLSMITSIHQTCCHNIVANFEINNQSARVDFALELDSLSNFTRITVLNLYIFFISQTFRTLIREISLGLRVFCGATYNQESFGARKFGQHRFFQQI